MNALRCHVEVYMGIPWEWGVTFGLKWEWES